MRRKRGIQSRLGGLILAGGATTIVACGLGSDIDDYASGTVSAPTGKADGGQGGGSTGAGAGAGKAGSPGASGASGGTAKGGASGSPQGTGTGGSAGQVSSAGGSGTPGTGGAHVGAGGGSTVGQGGSSGASAGHGGVGTGQGGAAQAGNQGGAGEAGMTSSLVGAPCSAEGTFDCDGHAVTTVLSCVGGHWMVSATCENGQLCDSSKDASESARCANPVAICIGHPPDAVVCDTVNRVTCGIDLVTSTSVACATSAQCTLGVGGACALCLPGAFQCTGAALSVCSTDGSAFTPVKTCASASLCNTTVGDCSNAVCAAGQYQCAGDELQSCKSTLDGWDSVTACSAGTCDAAHQHCDTCTPNSTSCKDGSTPQSCGADGVTLTATSCGAGTPHCVGNGQCVACTQATDCPAPSNACLQAACSNGTCGTSPVAANTATAAQTAGDCKTAVCDGMGGVTSIANPGDLPGSDGNPCHTPACSGSSPTYGNAGNGTSCGGSNVCNGGSCCTPATCATAGATCAAIPNGCGGTLPACTSCAAGSQWSCGASSTCVCTPFTADDVCGDCGSASNGCGGTVVCPNTCPAQAAHCVGNVCIPNACFAAGTMVSMADGSTKAIERIHVGDAVLTYDPETGTVSSNLVLETFDHDASFSESGTILINGEIEATPNHPFFSAGKWVRADTLTLGSELLGLGSEGAQTMAVRSATVQSIALRAGHIRTYNLEVQGAHDYFVDGILVHNKIQP